MVMLNGKGYAYRCGECDAEPIWSMTRRGDVACNWACTDHFTVVALDLQRDHEITELVVTHFPKAVEWAEIQSTLEEVANEGRPKHLCGAWYDEGQKYCPSCHMPTIPRRSS